MGFSTGIKAAIRRTIGLWPVLEFRNSLMMAHRIPGLLRFENGEVARLSRGLNCPPSALFACIIPTFKRPEGLLKAINSILAQEFQDFVIIVVDDGGGLPPLPDDPRIFAFSLSRNSAVLGLVRNVGVRLSQSDYVAFLDDDNAWTPKHLSFALSGLRNGGDMIYTAIRRSRPDGTELDVLSKPFSRKQFSDESSWVDANAIVLRRSHFLPFSRLPRTRATLPKEDWEFAWRVSKRAIVAHIEEATVEYLVNPSSYYTTWRPNQIA